MSDENIARPVADDFRDLSLTGYKNITEWGSQPDRLHGTETLCGDYGGRTLLLGQDFANVAYIKKMKKNNSGENPYHHSNDFDANHNLKEFLEPNHQIALDWSIAEARQCGLLYANLVWLLKDTKRSDGRLSSFHKVLIRCEPVFRATIYAMINLVRCEHKAILPIFQCSMER